MTNLNTSDTFLDFMLPDLRGSPKTLSGFMGPSQVDQKMGFLDDLADGSDELVGSGS